MPVIKVIIPAYNEARSIGLVVNDIPGYVSEIIVVDNNSTDDTGKIAAAAGAIVVREPKGGYGNACLRGMAYVSEDEPKPDIIVFLDGDFSDYPQDMQEIIDPIVKENVDFVVGARVAELRQKHSMTPQQLWGNQLATYLMRLFFNSTFTDLGPFRAIKYEKLLALNMVDKTYGWTVEMQLKVLRHGFTYKEVPVRYRNRIGFSKVSGTLKGTILAGIKIIGWILKYSLTKKPADNK